MSQIILLLSLSLSINAAASSQKPSPATVAEARAFVLQVDQELRKVTVEQAQTDWDKQTNINPKTEAAAALANEKFLRYNAKMAQDAARFLPIMDQLDADTRRQITLIRSSATLVAPLNPAHALQLAQLSSGMDAEYGKAKVCDHSGKNCKSLSDLESIMGSSRKPEDLLAAWNGWHDTMGKTILPMYQQFVKLGNEGARDIGFRDMADHWKSSYDMSPEQFSQEVDRLWLQVQPLYQDLHCYARQKLNASYGSKHVPIEGPLPAHLVGNMWAQAWNYIYPELEPYKGQPEVDVTPALKSQGYDAKRMVKLAESFFTSLDLTALPASFWEQSMLTKPDNKEVVCHASAWDPGANGQVRIKMCIKVNHEDLVTIHHELGHDYYFLSYFTKPIIYQSGANDGFHEAIGDTIALSMTPEYLKKVGLLEKTADNDKALINAQMQKALDKIAFLPFGLLVDKWRWDVFSGKISEKDWNQHWWDLRKQYQGISPPNPRSAASFDPGAKYHVPSNTPYMRYFLASILQFQFHRALCKESGHKGSLASCTIYGNKAAGAKLKAMLALGASRPWPEALELITGEKSMDSSAIIEYFAPLQAWLKQQNKQQKCGW